MTVMTVVTAMLGPRGFDPGLARHSTRELPVDQVVDVLEQTHAAGKVREYRERMRVGDFFPPISVVRRFGRRFLADGHKRYNAWTGLGASRIVVEVWPLQTWLADWAGQVKRGMGKNGRIVAGLFVDPEKSALEVRVITGHWKRVAVSLARRERRGGRPAPSPTP